MTAAREGSAVEPVGEAERAELLMHPLRQQVLAEAREASTAAEIARRIGLPAQKVNYHVRALVDAGFLKPAGEGRKRNLVEKRYQASAGSYLILPQVLGAVGSRGPSEADRFSASYLMHLTGRLQSELGAWFRADQAESVPTLSAEVEVRFDSAEQRAAFAEALREAISDVVATHTAPASPGDDDPSAGRPYRLVMGCYPIPTLDDEDVT